MITQSELEAASALKRMPAILERIANALEKKEQPQPKPEKGTPKWEGWVSVKDCLPEIGLMVIVMVPWQGVTRFTRVIVSATKRKTTIVISI